MKKLYVYFVLNPKTDEVKIGQTTDLVSRMRSLEAEEGTPLILLDTQEDAIPLEKRMHHRFSSLHTRGEWFKLEGELEFYLSRRTQRRDQRREEIKRSYSGECIECGSPVMGKMLYCGQPCKQSAYRKRMLGS